MTVGPKVMLELQRISENDTSDGKGGTYQRHYGIRNIRGTLTSLSATERVRPDKDTVYATHRFVCNVQPGLTISEDDRFRKGERLFDIEFVNNAAELDRHLEIDLLEIT